MKNKKIASFFSGVGGIDLGFKNAGFDIVYANDINVKACETYFLNFGEIEEKSIREIDIHSIPEFDVLVAGFPCQAFSIAGYRKGFSDDRGNLFFDLLKIIEARKPEIVFLENVKNLETHDGGNTFKVIKESLEANGYFVKHKVLNSKDYGNVPQNRERIYIVGFLNKNSFSNFDFPSPTVLTKTIADIIKPKEKKEENHYYYNKNPKFYNMLLEAVDDDSSVYQIRRVYIRKNQSGVCPTLTANMGGGGHNVPIVVDNFGIRRLTPRECFLFQGFPENFKLPEQANSHLYKQAGNSVAVPVIERIAKQIKDAII